MFGLGLVIDRLVYVLTGVISGALLYIRDDFKAVDRKTWLQVIECMILITPKS